ncbi:MAG: hypothetical protein NTZ79_18045 [Proteobacteria bacterium]|nr:hypothetical protein [Pseudomonadota bacterium]
MSIASVAADDGMRIVDHDRAIASELYGGVCQARSGVENDVRDRGHEAVCVAKAELVFDQRQ